MSTTFRSVAAGVSGFCLIAERGERNVSLENIVELARALGATASQLLEGIK
jgi:hypothetical protein